MGGVKVEIQPVAAVERVLDAARRAGLDRLEALLACTFTFDRSYFEQLLDALAECHPEGGDRLREIPVDVVCDHRHYRGHTVTYNVHCWTGDNLFHPKLLLLLFDDHVVWIEGSLNLTRAGYTVNRELVTFHDNKRCKLPHGVRELVRNLASQGVDAARRVFKAASGARTDVRNRSVTSLDSALLDGLLGRVKHAHSVYVVTPFLDHRDQAGPAIETAALKVLAERYPGAAFRIFLPEVTRTDGRPALQASKALFTQAFGPRVREDRLAFCGVPSDQHPLHAKLLAVRHGRQGARATVLTGSPNLTERALLKKGARANVELAREFAVRWKEVDGLLRPLGRRFKPLSECAFEPPQSITTAGWHALKSATYHPFRRELELEWRTPEYAQLTWLFYAGKKLAVPAEGNVKGFVIRNADLRLETVSRMNATRRSWCPIVIPIESRLALAELPEQGEPPPEWWLAQLGALPTARAVRNGETNSGTARSPDGQASFLLSQRVRDLADRMRYAIAVITDSGAGRAARATGHLDLLEKIFDVHDSAAASDPTERTWRLWVRLEVVQALIQATTGRNGGGRKARNLRDDLRRRLSAVDLPQEPLEHWRSLTETLS
ncbi:hypothetical protein SVA_3022 [Sulfurifustis variabilis]|uniref:Phospholipase D-like domain-containing protein n=1 Tax=Sulfurifustis variabilis TaxID=1675686 RepID=A0A1B4V7R7_9GAMM|nr:hypothetical protein [Sulfurifustis variabilis]BAU49570.1 hypothetical protein SVA_3022 [Sulfurifustis variabilis]